MPLTTESTTFSLDVTGRYTGNTLNEALDSANPTLHDDARGFDHIIIGGGSFGAVLAAHLLNRDVRHAHRVLVLEAGPLVFDEHVQNLPPAFPLPPKGSPGTIWAQPWNGDDSPAPWNRGFPGLAYSVGGRSNFWGGWSPYFIASELLSPPWPASVVADLTTGVVPGPTGPESYLDQAARQIGTAQTNDFVAGALHQALRDRLFNALSARGTPPGADVLTGNRGNLTNAADLEAPLAVSSSPPRPGVFAVNKFNGTQILIAAARSAQAEAERAVPAGDAQAADAKKRLMVVPNAYVTRLERSGNRVVRVWIARPTGQQGVAVPPGGRVFLALGTIESTRFVLNTVPENGLAGRNLMAHLRSNLTIRIPHSSLAALGPIAELAISALFVKGVHTHPVDGSKGHYHIQITATGGGELGRDSEAELFKKIPNIDQLDQFRDLTDPWIIITLRGIGEMVGDKQPNPQNRIIRGAPDANNVPVARVRLETNPLGPNDPRGTKDNDLWEAMNRASDEIAGMFAAGGTIQYLSRPNDVDNAIWSPSAPPDDLRKDTLSSTHHEAGTLWLGDNAATSVTDEWGQIRGADNLFAVGPALLPTIGSPNPMLSGVALTRRTADHLIPRLPVAAPEAGFRSLFDGTEGTYNRWRSAGPGTFALVDGLLIAQPAVDHTVFFYALERFNDFTLRLQFRPTGPADNSGVFVRFRYPHRRWPDLTDPRIQNNPSWVAVHTGFEVQIDDTAAGSPPEPNGLDLNRTGAIYKVPTAGPGAQNYTRGPALRSDDWNEYEIDVAGQTYTVTLTVPGQPPQRTTRFVRPNTPEYSSRGLATTDPGGEQSGYVGIQAYKGKIAFRNIRIKP
jgi:choline dehydrogenase-like flavoprotein